MEMSKRERRKLRLEKLRQESQEAQEEYDQKLASHQAQEPKKTGKLKYYIGAIAVLLFLVIAYSVYSLNKPGPYDEFAKCLSQKGAVMYGALDWCKFTQAQRGMFGKSFKYVNYHEFNELPGIKKTPTWVINGQWYENVQSFDKLAALTGCKI